MTKENESIMNVLSKYYYNATFDERQALAEIKNILIGKIKTKKVKYPHETACSCGNCANAAYKNSTLDRVIEMVENLE